MAMKPKNKVRVPRRSMAARDGSADFDTSWALLASSLQEIHTKNASNLSFEELYRNAYKLVLIRKGPDLYDRVVELEKNWLRNEVLTKVTAIISPSLTLEGDSVDTLDQANERRVAGERFLLKLKEVWEHHQLCMGMITDVLMYMDKVILQDKLRPSIYATAMCLFRDYVLKSDIGEGRQITVADVFEATVLFMIRLEREGNIIDRALIRHCIYMLEGLYETEAEEESGKLYITSFEPAFLKSSRIFYLGEGQRLVATGDASTFCKRVAERLQEEEDRCRYTLSPVTEDKIKQVIDENLIEKHIVDVISLPDSGVKYMLDNDRLADLKNVYELNSRIDGKKRALTSAVQARIVELGSEINNAAIELPQGPPPNQKPPDQAKNGTKGKGTDDKGPANLQTAAAIKWVNDVLQLKNVFDKVLEEAFMQDQAMQSSITTSFADFININSRNSEYLSLFFDENLKKGIRGKTEEEIDELLENGITLLRYIRDKDCFESYYKKHLSRRLLMKRSASTEAERQMIEKMKMEVGNTFTQKLEAMFRDMELSSGLTSHYANYLSQQGDQNTKRIELEISVLTSTMWPMEMVTSSNKDGTPAMQCNYPKHIEQLKQSFEQFYLGQHNGRKLSWQSGMGTADIRLTFARPNGKVVRHELNVSTYAMVILLLFNDLPADESLTFEEIQARTNIPTNELSRNLQSLAVARKTQVLIKEPMSKDVKPTDRFFFNEKFQSPYTKIKIGVVSSAGNKVENKDERQETEKKMNEERGGSIEAAIVRIMKQRKTLSHSQLIAEVISQLVSRFTPEVNMVKKRIESLIDREYIDRIPDSDPPAYVYHA
ncbi:Cullin 3 [Blastomyces parvus]|uniref:Cullin 3 n=1 Tax=Blastomyces parvus TaxID=2060905 RepID=A0A2B7WY81_9EURO|nr:Cullin 3 [Blastomyces parvus]